MDSEFPPDQSFELWPENCVIDRIVLCESREGAEVFLREVFPYFANCLVVSADRHFPRNEELNERVFRALREDPNLKLVVLGGAALRALTPLTERWWVMDDLVMQDFKRHPSDRAISLALTPQKMAFLIETYFAQWEKKERIANTAFAYRHFAEYNHGKFDWRAGLLGLPTGH
jgi:hypothetical protein